LTKARTIILTGFSKKTKYRRLGVAPFSLHEKVVALIDREAEKARQGKPSSIVAKMNSLVDPTVIRALYRASQAGVPIVLAVRGICCLRPGVPGLSERISVRSVVDRFLRYVRIDTQSKEDQTVVPSTQTQWTLANMLAAELEQLGASNVRTSEFCMVYASIPGNVASEMAVRPIGFIAHVDTSPAVTGTNVNPIIHANYQGGDIVLPTDSAQVITVAQNPILEEMLGDDIITTDGTTLLGSDDKAGVATIMTMIDVLMRNPEIQHGPIAIGFTTDEEVGIGIEKFDVQSFGADFAYTVDGGTLGEISDETWSARAATVTFLGKSTHPGTAKDVMVNSIYALADYVLQIPRDMLPETTEGRVGFVHPYIGSADVETSTMKVLLRDFELAGLEAK
jgi:tripeptide aminopeptidase